MSESPLKGIENVELVGGELCLDFTNTVHRFDREAETDEIASYDDLVKWAERAGAINPATASSLRERAAMNSRGADEALTNARDYRRALLRIFSTLSEGGSPAEVDLTVVRDVWAEALRASELVQTESGFAWRSDAGSSFDAVLNPIAHSSIDLLGSADIGRVRLCGAEDCTWLFVDRSKNRSRRWCQMDVCGNRAKAKRHYERNKATT